MAQAALHAINDSVFEIAINRIGNYIPASQPF